MKPRGGPVVTVVPGPMTPAKRWKLVSLALAGCLSYSWLHGDAASHAFDAPAVRARTKDAARLVASTRMSKDEVVRRLFAAKTVSEIELLANRLGAIGDDAAIDAVLPLVHDRRYRAPSAIVAAFGEIATEHAVDVLIELAASPHDDIRSAAADALGATRNRRAEPVLIELAMRTDDHAQFSAIFALAQVASERGIDALAQIASRPEDACSYAMSALARIEDPAGRAAIVKLVDAPSVEVAVAAIGQLTSAALDGELVAKLAGLARTGNTKVASAALGALAKAGDVGLPTLRDAALQGALETRLAAMRALAELDHPDVIATLRSILENEQGRAATEAARVLGTIDSDDAREALISAALADETGHTGAVGALVQQRGSDVEQALLVIAKSDSGERWEALDHLLRIGNAEALAIAVAEAGRGEPESRLRPLQALADARTEAAFDALVELVEQGVAPRARALAILGAARPYHPRVTRLLAAAVQSNDPEVVSAAAEVLARAGTAEARDALVAALASSDLAIARIAAGSLQRYQSSGEVVAALRSAAMRHPQLAMQVLPQLLAAGTREGIELARNVLTRGTPGEAFRAIAVLENAGTPAAVELLVEATRATDADVRGEAMASLVASGHKRAAELVAGALHDPEPSVRRSAARALGDLGTPRARDLLIAMSRSTDDDDRYAAVSSLRRFTDPDATRRLTELVRDRDPNIAYEAIYAVAGRSDALPTLRGLLADPGVALAVRRQAASELSNRGISDPRIDALLEDHRQDHGPYDEYED